MQNYLNDLNNAQREAVVNCEGPALVIAGAGSGKTRVLTYRIAHLLNKGVKSYKILSLTFTNKAAREMKKRIGKIIGEEKTKSLWMGTFHSIFAKFLRQEAKVLGYPSNFTIYDAVDTKSIIRSIIKDLKLDDKAYKHSIVYSRISQAKNNLITAAAYETNTQTRTADRNSKCPEIYKIYKIYSDRCFRSGAMDFDDLLLKTNILFRDHPKVLEKYQNKFDYVLVDEYQDTNYSQYLIVKKLSETHKNICVVGDDAQSIYSFRGAKIENILNFKKDYKSLKMYKLEQNYRSTQNIVRAANSIIEKNKNQIPKSVFSENEEGCKIQLNESLTDNEEGFVIINMIFDSVYTDHTEYREHAILYRTNAQSRIFEEALRKRNIPYKVYGGLSFYQRKEIKDIVAYFKLVVNKNDDEALKRIINYPKRGIGQTTVGKLEAFANDNNVTIWEIIKNIPKLDIQLNSRALNQIFGFAEMIDKFTSKLDVLNAYELGKEIASTAGILQDLFKDKAPESVARHENLQELLNGLKEFTNMHESAEKITLPDYLETVSLLTNEDNEGKEDNNKVTLMTIHSAKGLEFRNVYIVGVEEGLFPSEMTSYSPKGLEEERRLFYVAVTRAEKELVISYAGQRYKWGKLNDCTPGRFIRDIDPKYLSATATQTDFDSEPDKNKSKQKQYNFTEKNTDSKKSKKAALNYDMLPQNKKLSKIDYLKSSESNINSDLSEIREGIQVEHKRFGYGKVIKLENEYPNTKATIDFKNVGIKQLLLKFAKLNIKYGL